MRTLAVIGASLAGFFGGGFVGVFVATFIPGQQSYIIFALAVFGAVWLGMVVSKATRKGAA